MLGVLRGEDRVIGTIMLANRFGLSRGFTDDDRALFETLAANASAALQYDRLEHAVSELHEPRRTSSSTRPTTTRSPGSPTARCSASRCARRSSRARRARWP